MRSLGAGADGVQEEGKAGYLVENALSSKGGYFVSIGR